MDKKILFR